MDKHLRFNGRTLWINRTLTSDKSDIHFGYTGHPAQKTRHCFVVAFFFFFLFFLRLGLFLFSFLFVFVFVFFAIPILLLFLLIFLFLLHLFMCYFFFIIVIIVFVLTFLPFSYHPNYFPITLRFFPLCVLSFYSSYFFVILLFILFFLFLFFSSFSFLLSYSIELPVLHYTPAPHSFLSFPKEVAASQYVMIYVYPPKLRFAK